MMTVCGGMADGHGKVSIMNGIELLDRKSDAFDYSFTKSWCLLRLYEAVRLNSVKAGG